MKNNMGGASQTCLENVFGGFRSWPIMPDTGAAFFLWYNATEV